jgi:hypothetical protein
MLFKILRLFGLDVPAKIAAARTEFEHRVEEATGYARQATLTAAIVAAISAVAALLFLVAAGVGLCALYRVIAENYGVYPGMGIVAALLIAAGSTLLLVARAKGRSLSELRFGRSLPPTPLPAPERVAPQAPSTLAPPEAEPVSTRETAADLFEPLSFVFSKYVRVPRFGDPVLDQFVEGLKASAHGSADDAVRVAANLIRQGNRTELFATIGGAIALGWLLAKRNGEASLRYITPSS